MSRVAIIGGDDRVRGDDWGDDFRAFTGDDSGRLVKAAREGTIRGVIALSKFMHGALKNGLRSLPHDVKVVFYPGSLNSLRNDLGRIMAENFPPPPPPPETVKARPGFRATIGDVLAAKLNGVHGAPPQAEPRPFTEEDDRKLRWIVNAKGVDGLAERFKQATGQVRTQAELEERYVSMPLLHQLQPRHGRAMVSVARVLSDGLPHTPSDAYGVPAQTVGGASEAFNAVFGDSVRAAGEKSARRFQVADWAKFRKRAAAIGVDLPEESPKVPEPPPPEPEPVREPEPRRRDTMELPAQREEQPQGEDDVRAAVAALTEAVATVVEVVYSINGKLDQLLGAVAALKLRGGA